MRTSDLFLTSEETGSTVLGATDLTTRYAFKSRNDSGTKVCSRTFLLLATYLYWACFPCLRPGPNDDTWGVASSWQCARRRL